MFSTSQLQHEVDSIKLTQYLPIFTGEFGLEAFYKVVTAFHKAAEAFEWKALRFLKGSISMLKAPLKNSGNTRPGDSMIVKNE